MSSELHRRDKETLTMLSLPTSPSKDSSYKPVIINFHTGDKRVMIKYPSTITSK